MKHVCQKEEYILYFKDIYQKNLNIIFEKRKKEKIMYKLN